MRKSFKIGLALGIALLMLLPVYAGAQMGLNVQSGRAPIAIANIVATQGDIISFQVTCTSPSAQFSMILNPDPPPNGAATFNVQNATFTWNTGANPPVLAADPGAYTAVFQALYGTEVDQLIVTITINPPTTGGSTQQYTLGYTVSPTGAGTVTGAGTYNAGQNAQLTATANTGYQFSSWTENSSTYYTNPLTNIAMNANRTITANFTQTGGAPQQYTVTPTVSPSGAGSVSGGGTFNSGTTVNLQANANTGYTFANWTENSSTYYNNPYSFTLGGNRTITANFTQNGGGGGGGSGTYSQQVANAVRLTASAGNGWYGYVIGKTGQTVIPGNTTVWFLIDPSSARVTGKTGLGFRFVDYAQGNNLNVVEHCIDSNANEIAPFPVQLSADGNTGTFQYGRDNSTKRYLLEISDHRGTSTTIDAYWWIF